MTTAPEWDTRFETVLRGILPLPPRLAPDTCLRSHGLDSLASIEVLMELEDAYAVRLPDSLLTGDTFATPAALWRTLTQVRSADAVSAPPVTGR
ncbi:hypothetical protein GCM10020358_40450 [Amorphoplanes nipponensis]|uniref:Carrier domain-containing protein n=1 Tax=Actinoplanes nipponensis TaxID=135950 RepID=A0A919JDF5_9ACTN|nr:phosphopantetheine-binding protein [Actinoplanes nipponensis]GIE47350.1 hypothetical protein Ani05nite_08840 [Actinoplanes nipponensis]